MSKEGLKFYLKNPKRIYGFFASRGLLNWMSDKAFVKMAYKNNTGKKLNLKNPQTFNEKLQWMKVYDHNPLYTQLVDKYEVREFVENLNVKDLHLIPLLGVCEKFDDIDFDKLPERFVLKCTHDSGGLCICRDKSAFDKEKAKKKINKSLSRNFYYQGREWPYKNVKPRIIAEAYMDDFEEGEEGYGQGLTDYKFFTFNGEPKMLYISRGLENHATAKISFFDLNGEFMPFKRSDYEGFSEKPDMPKELSRMTEIARECSKKIEAPFLRVDLYVIKGRIYFSEFTFFPCGGMMPIDPPEWDNKIGSWIKLED